MTRSRPRRALSDAKVADAASAFAALGDETRLGIVARLCSAGPQSIVRLTEASRVTRQAVTKHLLALSQAGLVRGARVGRETVWELEPARFAEVRGYLDRISEQWDEAIGRLKTFVETPKSR